MSTGASSACGSSGCEVAGHEEVAELSAQTRMLPFEVLSRLNSFELLLLSRPNMSRAAGSWP